ncbi:hypothetical protein ACTFIZ_000802 [Dictyostelium cf. discoideum]
MKISFNIIFISFLIIKVSSYGEPNLRGNPNWFERSNHVLVNSVRIAPKEYQNRYTQFGNQDVLSPSIYPSVPPLFFEFSLGASALAHARDMSINNCFSHESCDGTDSDTRINQYYHCDEIHGENIASGYDSPLITNNQWVCDDGTNDPYSNPTCAQDASGSDGHRANIMNPNFKALGVGFSFTSDSTYHSYWTQDFGAQPCFNITNQPIHSGSHLFLKQNKLTFMVDWYDQVEPTVAYVVISGKPNKLNLEMGSKSKGIYSLSVPMENQKSNNDNDNKKSKTQQASDFTKKLLHLDSCRDYYFYFEKSIITNTTNSTVQVTDKGNVTLTSYSFSKSTEIFRYPHFGYLTTFGEGNCKRSYSINGTEYNPYSNFNSTNGMHSSTSSWSSTSSTSSWSSTSSTSSPSSTVSSTTNNNNGGNSNNSEQPSSTTTTSSSTIGTTMEPTTSTTIDPTTPSSTTTTATTPSTSPATSTTGSSSSSSSSSSDKFNSFESSIEIFNSNHKFIGCFNDDISHDLPFNEIFSINMTNDKCESYCTKNGYKYAGTELGTQCYCGNSYGHYGKAHKESDCNFKCGGDKSKTCGGNDKISVYKTSYNGCFSYEPLIGHFSISASSPNMTVEGCRAHCFKNHYLIAGLSRGNLCFCGNDTVFDQQQSENHSRQKSIPNCNSKCSGSNKENCGGVNEISIYSTENISNLLVPDNLKDTSSLLNQNQQQQEQQEQEQEQQNNSPPSLLSLQSYILLLIIITTFVSLI